MSPPRIIYWAIALLKNVASVRGVTAFLSSFGALWVTVEIADYFQLFQTDRLQASWPIFLIAGVVIAIWQCRPITSMRCQLNGRDIGIEIRVGNFFRQLGDFVVGTNTTFDTRIAPNLISEHSLQGQFTRKFYPSDQDFDLTIQTALGGTTFSKLPGDRVGKDKEYPVGTTVTVRVKDGARDRTAHLVAMARMNEHGNARTSPEDLREAMARLWVHVGERATKGVLVVPVLGSRFGRLPQREEIVRETINSFVAACAEGNFCEKLVIVLHPDDVVENNIDLKALDDYLKHTCKYTKLAVPRSSTNIGTPIGEGVPLAEPSNIG